MGNVQQPQQKKVVTQRKSQNIKINKIFIDKTMKPTQPVVQKPKTLYVIKAPFKAQFYKNMPSNYVGNTIIQEQFFQDELNQQEQKEMKLMIEDADAQNKENFMRQQSIIENFLVTQEKKIGKIEVNRKYFLKIKKKNYLQEYNYIKQLGRGSFGTVAKIKMKYGPHCRAVKIIKQNDALRIQTNRQKLFAEISLPNLLDHPNIGKLLQVFEYKNNFALVMQLCEGGDLLAYLKYSKIFKEIDASKIFYQIISAINYMHKLGICHRDIKPQNILYDNITSRIKIIDFGTAARFKPNETFKTMIGSPYYVAPEVINKNFNQKCDIWSCGVILYVILSGHPPFKGRSNKQLLHNIITKQVQFTGAIWAQRSKQCKTLISKMLTKDPKLRISSQQALNSVWLAQNKTEIQQLDNQYGKQVLGNLKNFNFQNKLKAVVYTYIASQLYENKDKEKLLKTFSQIDQDGSGIIDREELIKVFNQSKTSLKEQQIEKILNIIDTNGSGKIDFTQFLVAASNQEELLKRKQIQAAFSFLDSDHSGYISYEQIKAFLDDSEQTIEELNQIFRRVDDNNDGKISKQQFITLLVGDKK